MELEAEFEQSRMAWEILNGAPRPLAAGGDQPFMARTIQLSEREARASEAEVDTLLGQLNPLVRTAGSRQVHMWRLRGGVMGVSRLNFHDLGKGPPTRGLKVSSQVFRGS